MKPAQEFFGAASVPWCAVDGHPGAWERPLAADPGDPAVLTRITRWDPGYESRPTGPVTHDYVEEVYVLSGSFTDTTLGRTFGAGDYTSRPPGMVHGPWTSEGGCEMFEVRYRGPDGSGST